MGRNGSREAKDVDPSTLCSENNMPNYYVLLKNGKLGKSKDLIEDFMGFNFAPVKQNYGVHVSLKCMRTVVIY